MVIRTIAPVLSLYAACLGALIGSVMALRRREPLNTEARIQALTRKVRRNARLKAWLS